MRRKDREPPLGRFIRSCRRGIALDSILGFEPPVEGITDVLVRDHGVKPDRAIWMANRTAKELGFRKREWEN